MIAFDMIHYLNNWAKFLLLKCHHMQWSKKKKKSEWKLYLVKLLFVSSIFYMEALNYTLFTWTNSKNCMHCYDGCLFTCLSICLSFCLFCLLLFILLPLHLPYLLSLFSPPAPMVLKGLKQQVFGCPCILLLQVAITYNLIVSNITLM